MFDHNAITDGGRGRRAAWSALFALAAGLAVAFPGAAGAGVRDEINCLALNIYFEARGEPDAGRLAVGHVVMNRVSDRRYPGNVCAVVRQGGERRRNRCQFSWWCDGRSDRPLDKRAWEQSKAIAREIYWGFSEDMTGGALWYHAVYARPAWRKVMGRGLMIGRHIFYRDKAAVQTAMRAREAGDVGLMPAAADAGRTVASRDAVLRAAGAGRAAETAARQPKGRSVWAWIVTAAADLLSND